jgi:hypothetical protein
MVAFAFSLLPTLLHATTLVAQTPSLLRDLPSMHVAIDHFRVPMSVLTPQGADSLRQRVILHLRAAGMRVTDESDPITYGSFLNAPGYSFDKPTFLVSLNMVPDGCAFVVNFHLRMPVSVAGYRQEVPVSVYASSSYVYSTTWRDHSPVLNYLEDFVGAWRSANAP